MISFPYKTLYFGIALLVAGAVEANEDVHGNYWSKCDKLGIHFYNELGCKPNYIRSQTCPISYSCKDYVIPNGKCLFYGKTVADGETAKGSYCNQGYICSARPNEPGYFSSGLVIDCYFGPPQDGCYRGGELRSCCLEEICPTGDVYTCQVGNTTFKEGEMFTPEGTCWNCICKPGLQLFKKPYCIRRPCDMELRNAKELEKKCAPVYNKPNGLCCPRNFICPERIITNTPIKSNKDSKEKCILGNQRYNIGDQTEIVYKIVVEDKRICTCLVPPYLTCL